MLLNNRERNRFELLFNDCLAFIEYVEKPNSVLLLTHTEVPSELRGNGIGTKIVSETLKFIDENRYKIVPLCPFVAAFIRKHPIYEKIIADKQ